MRRVIRRTSVTLAALLIGVSAAPQSVRAQSAACLLDLRDVEFIGASSDVARVIDLLRADSSAETFMIRRSGERTTTTSCGVPAHLAEIARRLALDDAPSSGATLLPVDLRLTQNSYYPRDWNDGELRAGVGISAIVTGGAVLNRGGFRAVLAPSIALEQNESYPFEAYPGNDHSQYAHRWHGTFIDLPQQFGRGARTRFSAGHSFISYTGGGITAGLSNQNLRFGPALRNPLLLSGTAPGFPHVFFGTDGLRNAFIGDAEAFAFIGRLQESDHFDFTPTNDRRALFGAGGVLRPRGLEGLHLGASYQHMQTWDDGTDLGDLLVGPFAGVDPDSIGSPRDMRLYALWLRWAVAPAGLEVYGEWARQDTWENWLRILNPFDETQAYTIGLQKAVPLGNDVLRLSAEISHLADPRPHASVGRNSGTFYTSPYVTQGHTHRGQLLGAPIGPGSESQFLGADLFWKYGRSSLSVERARYDDDTYYAVWNRHHGPHGHDTEMTFRAGHMYAHPDFHIEAEFGYSFRYSRTFLGLEFSNYPGFPYRRDVNYSIRIGGRWLPRFEPLTWR